MRRARFLLPALTLLAACGGVGGTASAQDRPFQVEAIGQFSEPWAMTFLPGGDLLVTEKGEARHAVTLNPFAARLNPRRRARPRRT